MISDAMQNDAEAKNLLNAIQYGWPHEKCRLPENIKPYFSFRDTLSCENNFIFKGERIFVPKLCRNFMKNQLHIAHLGYANMMRRARDTIFWLGMSKDIKQIADNCHICQELKPSNQKESLRQHDECSYPWEKCGVDIFELNGKMYLVVVDYFSFFFEIDVLTTTTASNVIHCMKKHFARYGIPKVIVSDCGSQFMSCEFKKICDKWHITHITSSPDHQRENGKAEAAVKAAKHLLKTTAYNHED